VQSGKVTVGPASHWPYHTDNSRVWSLFTRAT